MESKIKNIIDLLQASNNMLFAENAFKFYIDNQINEKELKEILSYNNFSLPDYFYDMPIRKKKTFLNHIQTRIYFDNNKPKIYSYEVFNKNYFYYLVECAKKNKSITEKLIDYVNEIGIEVNLMFLGMEHIKIQYSKLARYETIMNYCKDKKINNIYDLLVSLFSYVVAPDDIKQLQNLLIAQIKKENMLNFDLDDKFVRFALYIECILNLLSKKEANTLKIKFNILNKEYLRENDYYDDELHQKRIINTFKKKIKDNKILNLAYGLVLNNQEEFSSFGPNGYSSIYYYFLEE